MSRVSQKRRVLSLAHPVHPPNLGWRVSRSPARKSGIFPPGFVLPIKALLGLSVEPQTYDKAVNRRVLEQSMGWQEMSQTMRRIVMF